jgi:hypothetical protein
MTHCIRLTRLERATLALANYGELRPRKHFARQDIPKIRRMVRDGWKPIEIINALGLGMEVACFRRRCKELQINFSRRIDTSHI